jgi:hypothetical protein
MGFIGWIHRLEAQSGGEVSFSVDMPDSYEVLVLTIED